MFERPEIRGVVYKWRDTFDSSRIADMRVEVLSTFVSWMVDRSILTTHHLKGMKKLYKVDRSDIVWTSDEIEAFEQHAPAWVSRILVAATETGLRPKDLASLSRSHIKTTAAGQRRIVIRTSKRGRFASIPLTPKMAKLVDATPKDRLQILAQSRGQAFTEPKRLGRVVGEWRDKLELRGELHLYDARGTAATRLFMAGATLSEIATHMGWSATHAAKLIEVYCRMSPDATDDVLVKLAAAR